MTHRGGGKHRPGGDEQPEDAGLYVRDDIPLNMSINYAAVPVNTDVPDSAASDADRQLRVALTLNRRRRRGEVAVGGDLAMLVTWTWQETRLLLRDPVTLFFCLVFPSLVYLFVGPVYGAELMRPGIRLIDAMFPGLIGVVAAMLLLLGLPAYFADLRARGVIRRYRTIPLAPWRFAAAIVGSKVLLFLVSAVVTGVVVGVDHGLAVGLVSFRFLAVLVGLVGWLACVGFFLGTLPGGRRTVRAVSTALFVLMIFGSGLVTPASGWPRWLELVTRIDPLRHWFGGLIDAYCAHPSPPGQIWRMLVAVPFAVLAVLLGVRNLRREAGG